MSKNPVLESYKGVNIRQCNKVVLSFGKSQFKRLVDECEATGLSIPKVLYYSGQPCEKCKNYSVTFFDEDGNAKKVRKGILDMPGGSGIGIIEKAKKRHAKSS